jgi:hypothetical protein
MKKLIILTLSVIIPLLASAGERVYWGSHSIAESRKNKLLIDEFDTTNVALKTPNGWAAIKEAWIEKATIAGGLFRTWKKVDGYRIVIRVENLDDWNPQRLGFITWPDAKYSFSMHADIDPKNRRFQHMSRSQDLPEYPITLHQRTDWKSILHAFTLKKKEANQ